MEKPMVMLLLGILVLAMNHVTAQKPPKSPLILVDPGHGGMDGGASSGKGQSEKDIVFKIVQEMVRLNRELLGDPLELYRTRYSDTLISLGDRALLAKALGAHLFVSIHGNQAPNPFAQGIEAFTWNPFNNLENPFEKESTSLADAIISEMQNKLGLKSRGIKRANFQVLRDNRELCPAILLEVGFLSNGEEAAYLRSERGITAMATAILMGLSKYIQDGGIR